MKPKREYAETPQDHEEALKWLKEYQKGNVNEAWPHLEPYVKKAIKIGIGSFYVGSFEPEDLYHEVLCSLLPYLKRMKINTDRGTLFSLLVVSAKRRMITIVKLENNNKRKTLNQASSLNAKPASIEENSYIDILEQKEDTTPLPVLNEDIIQALHMSPKEESSFRLWRAGFTYEEVAEKTGLNVKIVDNALQRVKKKIRKLLADDYQI